MTRRPKIHYRSEENEGVLIDFTADGHRYIVISDDMTDCGESSLWRYSSRVCRCGACKALWAKYQRERAAIRKAAKEGAVCPHCGHRLRRKKKV